MVVRRQRALDLGDVLGATFRVWLRNFVPFTLISIVVWSPAVLLVLLAERGAQLPEFVQENAPSLLFQGLGSVAAGAYTYGVVQSLGGRAVPMGECLVHGFARLVPILGVSLLVAVLVTAGLAAYLVPGYFLMCILAVAVPAAAIEGTGLVASLRRSAALTKGFKWTIFLIQFVLGTLAILIGLAVGLAFVRMDAGGFVRCIQISSVVAGVLGAALPAVLYQRLREITEGTSVEDLAKVFD